MNARIALAAAMLCAAAPIAGAQQSSPLADAVRAATKEAQQNLVGAAELMPADKYGYKPTAAQMSFGQLMLHVAGSNDFLCSRITGAKAPTEAKLDASAAKDVLVARLKRSFEYCTNVLANVTDAGIADSIPFFGGHKVTKAAAMVSLAADWDDHYAAAAIYLRLNNILPPTARKPE
ncbi:MAG TPA: DinB family protein [Gemmatimonadaceae bacterium]|jgi:hypothetical protein|nr:DinB family protein [Gemmatimonadaceae bacterium]